MVMVLTTMGGCTRWSSGPLDRRCWLTSVVVVLVLGELKFTQRGSSDDVSQCGVVVRSPGPLDGFTYRVVTVMVVGLFDGPPGA